MYFIHFNHYSQILNRFEFHLNSNQVPFIINLIPHYYFNYFKSLLIFQYICFILQSRFLEHYILNPYFDCFHRFISFNLPTMFNSLINSNLLIKFDPINGSNLHLNFMLTIQLLTQHFVGLLAQHFIQLLIRFPIDFLRSRYYHQIQNSKIHYLIQEFLFLLLVHYYLMKS